VAFFPLRATTTAADPKRDARAALKSEYAAELSAYVVARRATRADKSAREMHMTRRPPRAGAVPGTSSPSDHACIFSTCWPRSSLNRNFPSGMGDRRVGAWLPCKVHRFVAQDYA
jgi:hypothetical protein